MNILRNLCDRLHQAKRRRAVRNGEPSGILLVSSGGVGDTILFSLIAPRFAALATPGEAVDIVVQRPSMAVEFLFRPPSKLIALDYRRFIREPLYRYRFQNQVFQRNYRIAVSTDHLRLPTADDAIVAAAGAPQSFALTPRPWPKHDAALARNRAFYSQWTEPSPGMAHRMVRWSELLTGISGQPIELPRVRFDDTLMPPPEAHERPYVVLHPFSSEAPRNLPPEVWLALESALSDEYDLVLSVGPGDLERCPEYRPLAQLPSVRPDERGLFEKLALFRGAALVVTVDTSVMHLAVGSGARTICLSSAAHVIDSVPYDPRMTPDNVTFLYQEMPCQGCLGACIHPLERGRFACVVALTPERVTAAVAEQLGS